MSDAGLKNLSDEELGQTIAGGCRRVHTSPFGWQVWTCQAQPKGESGYCIACKAMSEINRRWAERRAQSDWRRYVYKTTGPVAELRGKSGTAFKWRDTFVFTPDDSDISHHVKRENLRPIPDSEETTRVRRALASLRLAPADAVKIMSRVFDLEESLSLSGSACDPALVREAREYAEAARRMADAVRDEHRNKVLGKD